MWAGSQINLVQQRLRASYKLTTRRRITATKVVRCREQVQNKAEPANGTEIAIKSETETETQNKTEVESQRGTEIKMKNVIRLEISSSTGMGIRKWELSKNIIKYFPITDMGIGNPLQYTNVIAMANSFLSIYSLSEQWGNIPEWCMERNVCAAVLVPGGHSDYSAGLLHQFVSMQRLKLAPVPPPNHKDHYNNRSLLTLFELESSLSSDSTYMFVHKHLAIYAKRVARTMYPFFTLATYADIVSKFSKANESLSAVEEEACKYILENKERIDAWLPPEDTTIYIRYFFCQDDSYVNRIEKAMDIVQEVLQHRVSFTPQLLPTKLICDNGPASSIATNLEEFTRNFSWPYLGAVVAPTANVTTQYLSYSQETLLMLYESQESPSPEYPVFLSTADRDSVIAAAVSWLVNRGYETVTLKIENRSPEYIENIQKQLRANDIFHMPYKINTTAQVLIADAGPDTVERLACNIAENSFSTILLSLREWSSRPLTCSNSNVKANRLLISMWTVSSSWQDGSEDWKLQNDTDVELRQRLQGALGNNWPSQIVPMADAILTAAHALNDLYHQYPQFIYDLHGENVTSRLLYEIVKNSKTKGVAQLLQYTKNNSLNEPLVFITHWRNGTSARLDAVMGITTPSNGTHILWVRENQFNDTSSSILIYSMFSGVIMIFLCILGFKYWQAKYQKPITLLKWPVPDQLAAFEMRRDELELHEKLGEGVTGRVFLALWRGRKMIHVAVKTPVVGSSGAPALLWEARMMAPLEHPNVVRLLGIVANGPPPLIVLEYAINGDLRRYLAETKRATGGLKRVSPVLLTRLAREAAAALAYLASRNIVHRDIRAANCLIDEYHTLKLADFGLARALPRGTTEGVGKNQYLCRRRALFPVSWMAPESLNRGVFSLASDMWSYGVLLVELVTMGARPFGDWPPHVTLCHVVNGGTPPLPPDVSLDMFV
ncbi:Tyrosine-protein kinase transforming protein Abl [Eumeta japonica]|uniref:Tyrosine-protein kinase transforming protein Abl n=1 Tax=Eumeta variegata TaxID=151549 RepID=A0A4C1U3C5_EUMVA|nr:Tyrosine-protein kinase transforming protein Abl [Eumeta japonica]